MHGVMPLVARNLHSTCPDVVPPDVLVRLQGDFAGNSARNLFLLSELFKILGLLADRGIPAIPLKGPVLAGWFMAVPRSGSRTTWTSSSNARTF